MGGTKRTREDSDVPSFKITAVGHEGCSIPKIGLGTATLKGDVCKQAVALALRNGYKAIDTALLYDNQVAVGQGIRASGVARDDIFVTSKIAFFPKGSDESVWMFNKNNVKGGEEESLDLCLKQLDLEYVDLLLVHNPITTVDEYRAASWPHFFELFRHFGDANALPDKMPGGEDLREIVQRDRLDVAGQAASAAGAQAAAKEERKRVWQMMERAKASGKARMIGVSNYPAQLLREMKTYATVMPAVNQLELHPRFTTPTLQIAAKELGCILTGYGMVHSVKMAGVGLENEQTIKRIAEKHATSALSIVLAWASQKGIVVIPRTADVGHMKMNLASLDLELTADEIVAIDKLDRNHPYYWLPEATLQTIAPRLQTCNSGFV